MQNTTFFVFFIVNLNLPSWKKKKIQIQFFPFLFYFIYLFIFLLLKLPWLPSPKRPDVLPDTSDKLQLLFQLPLG